LRRPTWATLFCFQAEDGIRDFHVTGVQTCALPICDVPDDGGGHVSPWKAVHLSESLQPCREMALAGGGDPVGWPDLHLFRVRDRSEERRVGKEGRRPSWPPRRHTRGTHRLTGRPTR